MKASNQINETSPANTSVRQKISRKAFELDSLFNDHQSRTFDGVKKFANGDDDVIRQSASLRDVVDAAEDLLDPIGSTVEGRSLLRNFLPVSIIEWDLGGEDSKTCSSSTSSSQSFRTNELEPFVENCSQEVEAWLLSLAVHILQRDERCTDALSICSSAIGILSQHIHNLKNRSPATPQKLNVRVAQMEEKELGLVLFLDRLQMQQQSIAHRCVKAMLDEGSHIGNRSSGNNNHLTKLRRSVDSKASILNLQLRELSADDDPKGTPVAVFQQRRTHAQQQKRKYPKEIRHYLYPHLLYHPGFY